MDSLEEIERLTLTASEPIAIDETAPLELAAMPGDQLAPELEPSSVDLAAPDPTAAPAVPESELTAPSAPSAPSALELVIGTDGDDNLQVITPGHELQGLAGNDVLSSDGGGNVLDGGADGDVLCSTGGDTLIGGAGFDRFLLQLVDDWAGPVMLVDFDANDCIDVVDKYGHGITGLTVEGATVMYGDIAVAVLSSPDLGYLINL